jgi:hypothetical protein
MIYANAAQSKIDDYLQRLRTGLRGLRPEEINDIVDELRSHIVERASSEKDGSATVDTTLVVLGSPEALAREYLTDALLARAEVSRSPARILATLFRWATLSVTGFFVFFTSVVGYGLGISLFLVGLLKPLHVGSAGLWIWPDSHSVVQYSMRLGFGTPPANARELLGFWAIPVGLLLGGGLIMLTTHLVLWFVRRNRTSRALRQREFRAWV